jgi:GH24 family phage-related lysozyme (muramidase)
MLDYDGGALLALISASFNLGISAWRPAGVWTHFRRLGDYEASPETGRSFSITDGRSTTFPKPT